MSVTQVNFDEFRKRLAGYEIQKEQLDSEQAESLAVEMACIGAQLYSDDLDRKLLWDRIGNGLVVASSKSGSNAELCFESFLSFIKADFLKAATNKKAAAFLAKLKENKEIETEFCKVCSKKHFVIVLKARNEWDKWKKEMKAMKMTEELDSIAESDLEAMND